MEQRHGRYAFRDRPRGISESEPLDFHSPTAAARARRTGYVRDYARIYGLRTVVFRQSCIYGWRQFGVEDQGWVAWFTIAAVTGKPVTIYGDGRQVRDLLFVDDLCEAYDGAVERIDRGQRTGLQPRGWARQHPVLTGAGRAAGPAHRTAAPPRLRRLAPGDQPVFVADVSRASEALGWRPRTGVTEGVEKLAGSRKTEPCSAERLHGPCGEGCSPDAVPLSGM